MKNVIFWVIRKPLNYNIYYRIITNFLNVRFTGLSKNVYTAS